MTLFDQKRYFDRSKSPPDDQVNGSYRFILGCVSCNFCEVLFIRNQVKRLIQEHQGALQIHRLYAYTSCSLCVSDEQKIQPDELHASRMHQLGFG